LEMSLNSTSNNKVKELGQVITPREVAKFLVRWAIKSPEDIILDPGCGDGVFLLEAASRLLELGVKKEDLPNHLFGVEIDEEAIKRLKQKFLMKFGVVPTIIQKSFFEIAPPNTFFSKLPPVSVVVGNPPYIRYQLFKGEDRKKALRIAMSAGVKLSELTASWVPFIIHAESFLKSKGRMAIVLPTKLLNVEYAKPFRKWLLKKFKEVYIIVFEERVFRTVLEDTLLLLANKVGRGGAAIVKVRNERDLKNLDMIRREDLFFIEPTPEEKWTKYIISRELSRKLSQILKKIKNYINTFGEYAYVTIGAVTGCNKFFLLSQVEVKNWEIEDQFLTPVVSKAEDIKGILFREEDWEMIRKLGKKCYLLNINLSPEKIVEFNVHKYLEYGLKHLKLTKRYKIKIRKIWYSVPYVRAPDAFFTYMSHTVPRLSLNLAGATSTNTIHNVFFKERIDGEVFVASFYNSLTLLSTELAGRYYGGGVLKIEPKELEKTLIPYPLPQSTSRILKKEVEDLDKLMRRGKYDDVVALIDEILLKSYLKLSSEEVNVIEEYYREVRENRLRKNF